MDLDQILSLYAVCAVPVWQCVTPLLLFHLTLFFLILEVQLKIGLYGSNRLQHPPLRRPDVGCLDIYTHVEIYMRMLAQSTININTIALSESSRLCQQP